MILRINTIITILLLLSITNIYGNIRKNKIQNFDTIYTNIQGNGINISFVFEKGISHNHPTFAIWIESLQGKYIQSLFITQYIATGKFGHGPVNDSVWGTEPGNAYRPAALPYWNHKRIEQPEIRKIMPDENNPLPDAYTSATPGSSFILKTKTNEMLKGEIRILIEINQTWDWNEYWTNNKFPEDKQYKTSCQPSIIYAVTVDLSNPINEYWLNPIGHGHYSGLNGHLFTNLSTLTTAKKIFKSIKIVIAE